MLLCTWPKRLATKKDDAKVPCIDLVKKAYFEEYHIIESVMFGELYIEIRLLIKRVSRILIYIGHIARERETTEKLVGR